MNSVENNMSKTLSFDNFYFWADSKVTVAWISAVEKEYRTFVENRVQRSEKLQMFVNGYIVTLKKILLI